MTPTIVYDTPEQQIAADMTRAGLVYCDIAVNPKKVAVHLSIGKGNKNDYRVIKLEKLGGHWNKKHSYYELPLTLINLIELERFFGEKFEPSERLDDWGWDRKEELGSLDNLTSASSDAELSDRFKKEAPVIARMAHPYQRAGIAFGARTRRMGLFDQPGLGKTLQCAGIMVEADITGDILVFAPSAAVAITWPDELGLWLPQDEVVVVTGSKAQRSKLLNENLAVEPRGKRRWFILNLEMGRATWVPPKRVFRRPKNQKNAEKRWMTDKGWWEYAYPQLYGEFGFENEIIEKPPWAAIVVDESHRALITQKGHLWQQTLVRAGMAQVPLEENGVKIAMSGTPMRGKPENLWGTLNFLYPDRYSAFWNWAERWFTIWKNGEGPDAEKNIESLDETRSSEFYQDIKPYMLRRTKKEVRAELPDKLYAGTPLPDESGFVDENSPVGHWLPMSAKQQKCYDDIVKDAETQLESGTLTANGWMAELTRLKQLATAYGDKGEITVNKMVDGEKVPFKKEIFYPKLPSNKFDWLVEFLDDLGINKHSTTELEEDGEEEIRKVVVASQFTTVIDLFADELEKRGIPCLKITGKVKTADRVEAAHRWQKAGGPRVFLLNTMAGGVALTLDAADDLVLLDETFIPDEQEQVEDRIHRVSRLHQVTIHYLRSIGTIEETIALTTANRERLTKLLLDGERGVNFVRKLLTPIQRDPRKTA